MKVTGINNSAFKGLEGYTEVKQLSSNYLQDSYDRKIPYFPFKNETKQEIDAFVKANTYTDEFTAIVDYDSGESIERTNYYSVVVKEKLPFDNTLWNSYKKNKYKLSEFDRNFIEYSLKELNLKQHIKPKNLIKYIIANW